jgi:hypothetical protein
MQNRRRLDYLEERVQELEARLKQLNQGASKADEVMDAELRAIQGSLPHYKEAVRLEIARRAKGSKSDRRASAGD